MESSSTSDDEGGAISWIFSAEVLEHKTPSREDGISSDTERKYRREGARFIINASNTLKLRRDTLATGAVFFHRFYMVQSFKDFDRWVVASTCILLAGKVEETPKMSKSILKVVQELLTPEQMKAFGNDPKEELLSHERVLLQTIRFDLQVHHPYDYLLKFAETLKGEKSMIQHVLQLAWTFINDSLCTTLSLQWEPKAIAVAMLYLSGKLSKFDLQSAAQGTVKRSWWRQFVATVDVHDLESICHQVLDVYGEGERNRQKQEEENAKLQNTGQAPVTPGPKVPPPVPPLPVSKPVGHIPYLPVNSTTHMSYATQPALVSQMTHAHSQSIIVPPQTIINQQQQQPPPTHLGTPPMLNVYQSMVNQPRPVSNPYQHTIPTTGNRYHPNPLQMQHPSVIPPHLGQISGGINSHYTNSGVNSSIPMATSIPRQQQMYPGTSLLPPPLHTPLHTPPPPHRHQSYHTTNNSGTWR